MIGLIELFEQDIKTNDRQSSKGNQLKWENKGIWYKADFTGYEGLAEYVISQLLRKSSLLEEEFVIYELEEIKYKSTIYNGVKSNNFLKEGWQLITLERLFQNYFGQSLYQSIYKISEPEERLKYLVWQVERITGLKDFGIYMNKLFTVDAFFLNEDRHMHNIAVLMDGAGEFAYAPIFDNGAGLLSDTTMDYPVEADIYTLLGEVHAKTICSSFDEQLDVSEILYRSNLELNFTRNDVKKLLETIENYPSEIVKRVETILYQQMRKYQYLFK